ncbi:MAG: hypothetical protein K0R09_3288 [Clostridiales bacterium]|nr:hypothetical protein [Clostridiales bacterium]
MKKYYHAYNERYKKVHEEGLLWFSKEPTPEVLEWIKYYNIRIKDEICEIGCGEGRDSLYLAQSGYCITAIDSSEEAIKKCKDLSREKGLNVNWIVKDALEIGDGSEFKKFKWIYTIATLHMLVDDEDRIKFLTSIYNLLEPSGKLLLLSLGDGVNERSSDISTAFELQERNHMWTGRKMNVAGTSYRGVNWANHKKELEQTGFHIEKTMNTENMEYNQCMTVYLSK